MAGLEIAFIIIVLLFSVIIHELAHGWVALSLGDDTAKMAGRLTLNPLKHLDPIGSILVPGFLILMSFLGAGGIIFGWAKPVPINPYKLRDKRWGDAKVAIAGPAANIALALIFGLSIRFIPVLVSISGIFIIFLYIVQINLILALFNLLPVPPLDGSHILFSLLPRQAQAIKIALSQYGFLFVLIIVFFFFNIIIQGVQWLTVLITGLGI
jgi:Zn-dependent protease